MPTLLDRAKSLRIQQTDTEKHLWFHLRSRRMNGLKFRRQVTIGNYIADFVCIDRKMIIEVDGGQHGDQQNYDQERTDYLKSRGYHVLRFWNHEVLGDTDSVLDAIWQACCKVDGCGDDGVE